MAVSLVRFTGVSQQLMELVQGVDAAVNEVIVLSLAVFFLVSVETRLKRNRTLRSATSTAQPLPRHRYASVDQGSAGFPFGGPQTASSPQRLLTPFQLARYLDYCSELLSLTSKLAVLHVQYLRDPVVLEAVNDVESLAAGLSQKIWQKISVLEIRLETLAAKRTSPGDDNCLSQRLGETAAIRGPQPPLPSAFRADPQVERCGLSRVPRFGTGQSHHPACSDYRSKPC